MASKLVDARGRSCPEPVILAKQALETNSDEVTVLVDTVVARENVKRFAENRGYKVIVTEIEQEYKLTITK